MFQSIAVEIGGIPSVKCVGEIGLLRDGYIVCSHLVHGLSGRHDREVVQVMSVIIPRRFIECGSQFIDRQFDRSIADRMNAELPARSMRVRNRFCELIQRQAECATIVSLAFVGLFCESSRPGETTIDENLDRADPKMLIAVSRLFAKGGL